MNEISPSDEKNISRLAAACMVAVAGISGIALLGWLTGLLIIAQANSQFIPMAPSTALMFLLLSACWFAYRRKSVWHHSGMLAGVGTLLVMFFCSILFIGFLEGITFGFEEYLVPNPARFGLTTVRRMSPITALAFLLAGLSLLLLIHPIIRRRGTLGSVSGVAVSYVGFIIVVGYLFGAPLLYGSTIIPVALTTAVCFVLLGIGLSLSTGPTCWPSNRLFGSSIYARLLRPFLLLTVAITLFYGWYSAQAPLIHPALAGSLVLLVSLAIVSVVVSRIARTVGGRIERAEEAFRMSVSQTAAMVGHDLRNPLQGIAGAVHVLKQDSLPAKERSEMLELIEDSVEYSDSIVRDLSDYSAEIRLDLVETTPKSIVAEAVQSVKVPGKVAVLDSSEASPEIRVDRAMMKRVFINLIENAIYAMPQGGTLTISSKRSNRAAEIELSDTGSGIPGKIMENLWKPLQTTKPKGLGLGLAICKRIVDAHGGTITVKSKIGEGTTFTIRLPIEPGALVDDGGNAGRA